MDGQLDGQSSPGDGALVSRAAAAANVADFAEWDDLVDRSPVPCPWVRPGWIGAWWRAFGHGELAVTTLRRGGGRLAALAPLVRQRRRLSAPANYHTPAFELVGEDDEAVAELAGTLFADRPRCVRLKFVDTGGTTARALQRAARSSGYRLAERTLERSPYLDTTVGWPAYHDALDAKLRRELRRRRRRLDGEGRVEVAVADGRDGFDGALDGALDELIRVEGLAWKARRGSAIGSDPATAGFYREVAAWAAARGTLRLASLRLDGRPLAVDLAIEEGGRHYLLKTGYDPAVRHLAPGLLLRLAMIERAFSCGLRSYEFLGADEPWKLAWTGVVRERVELQAFGPGVGGMVGWGSATYARPLAVRALARLGR